MKPESFENFLTDNEKRIYNYLLRFVEVDEDAHDLVQNVFLAFYERMADIEEKTAVAYLYRMAHNMALNWIKHHKRMILKAPSDFNNLSDKPHSSPEPDYRILNKAIQELPVKLSTVIHLQYYDNMSYKAISDKLGISVKAVESLLVRAKKQLRKKIIKETGGDSVFKYRQNDLAEAR
jgi:RNA polymerase sigma-70 factor (ECF subfamily)